MEAGSSDFCRGLLRGLFDADGSVQGTQDKGLSVRLTQADAARCKPRSACCCAWALRRRSTATGGPAGVALAARRPRRRREYPQQAVHELVISGDNLAVFADRIGFEDDAKAERLAAGLAATGASSTASASPPASRRWCPMASSRCST
jgi:ribonucleoside-diphosphate reductase alpha chain